METFKLNAMQIAEIIHSVTSRIPRIDGSLVDVWCDLSESSKTHAEEAVKTIMNSPTRTPEELHNLWMKPLIDQGWVKGDYNHELKTHPSIVSFDELPLSEILKDEIWYHMTECFRKYYTQNEDESSEIF